MLSKLTDLYSLPILLFKVYFYIYFSFSFLAGFVARKMGIPINLIATVNPNDIVHRTFKSGDYSLAKEVRATWASAMDIQVSKYR